LRRSEEIGGRGEGPCIKGDGMPHRSALAAVAIAGVLGFAAPALAGPDLTSEVYGRSDFLGGLTYAVGDELLLSFKMMNRAAATATARGTLSAGSSGWMADVILSSDARGPGGFAVYSPTWREDVLLRGGRMSRTNDLPPGGEQMFNGPTVMRGGPPARPYDYLAFPMPTGMRPGRYYVCVIADPANVIAEDNELNNATCQAITIRPRLSPPRLPPARPLPTPSGSK
jgi:hypothetical protein